MMVFICILNDLRLVLPDILTHEVKKVILTSMTSSSGLMGGPYGDLINKVSYSALSIFTKDDLATDSD